MLRSGSRPPRKRVAGPPPAPSSEARFKLLDPYRVDREWKRYEGTAQRDLFLTLRIRFLARHPPSADGPILEVGPGPGRFSRQLLAWERPLLLLDLSRAMLDRARETLRSSRSPRPPVGFLLGTGRCPPVHPGVFAQVVLLGNLLGFASARAQELLERCAELVRPGGSLLLEIAPGVGESSRYLHRLPPTATRRLLCSPLKALIPRVMREGFRPGRAALETGKEFRRLSALEVSSWLGRFQFAVEETSSVAPCFGVAREELEIVREDPRAWSGLLALEEAIGARPDRWKDAATLLVMARKSGGVDPGAPARV